MRLVKGFLLLFVAIYTHQFLIGKLLQRWEGKQLHLRVIDKCTHLAIKVVFCLIDFPHHTHSESFQRPQIVVLDRLWNGVVLDYILVEAFQFLAGTNDEVIEVLLELTNCDSKLREILCVVDILLHHKLLGLFDQLIDLLLVAQIECTEDGPLEIIYYLLKVPLQAFIED